MAPEKHERLLKKKIVAPSRIKSALKRKEKEGCCKEDLSVVEGRKRLKVKKERIEELSKELEGLYKELE
jgi:hypothetical protein